MTKVLGIPATMQAIVDLKELQNPTMGSLGMPICAGSIQKADLCNLSRVKKVTRS